MNKLSYLILMLLCTLFLGACSSSDGDNTSETPTLQKQIVGSWYVLQTDEIHILNFNSDLTATYPMYRYSQGEWSEYKRVFTYSVLNDQLTIQPPSGSPLTQNALIKNDTLILFTEGGETHQYKRYDGKQSTIDKIMEDVKNKFMVPLQAVDLGLPSGTKWANMNVGAITPEDDGDYFAWGEVEPKSAYNWDNYLTSFGGNIRDYNDCGSSRDPLVSYVYPNSTSFAGTAHDVAHVKMGGNWQMPTIAQFEELNNPEYTTREWHNIHSIFGILFTSKINGNSIFLPEVGGYTGDELSGENTIGYYWPAISNGESYEFTKCFAITSKSANLIDRARYYGFSVRAVSK